MMHILKKIKLYKINYKKLVSDAESDIFVNYFFIFKNILESYTTSDEYSCPC
jgi:hypothetical protein